MKSIETSPIYPKFGSKVNKKGEINPNNTYISYYFGL